MENSVTVVIPHYNEQFVVVQKTILAAIELLEQPGITGEIILFDGGSHLSSVKQILEFVKNLENDSKQDIQVISPFPPIRSNKNLGILHSAERASSSNIIIVDSDWPNMSADLMSQLVTPLFTGEIKLTLPDPCFPAGRDNRLVGAPILRIFFPEIYQVIKLPFPGMLAASTSVISEIIQSNYHPDWGGELQLLVSGFFAGRGSIANPVIPLIQQKYRSIRSKIDDAYQMWRTGLFLGAYYGRMPHNWYTHVASLLSNYSAEVEALHRFLKNHTATHMLTSDPFLLYEQITQRPVGDIVAWLLSLFELTSRAEFLLIAYSVAMPLTEIVHESAASVSVHELSVPQIKGLDLKSVGILCDLVACAILSSSDKLEAFSSSEYCIDRVPAQYSELNTRLLPYLEYQKKGIDLRKLDPEALSLAMNCYTRKLGPLERAEQLIKVLQNG